MENKVSQARNLTSNLQSELDKAQGSHAETERSLRSQLDEITSKASGGGEWRVRFETLDREHQELRTQLLRQEKVTSEVKEEAASWLNQMKILSERVGPSHEREERMVHQVHALERELQDWKSRYAKTKTQLRTLRASSISDSLNVSSVEGASRDFVAQDGLVRDVHVTKFQLAIDELLKSAHGNEADTVLAHVKSVIIAVRNISLDIGDTQSGKDEVSQQKNKIQAKLSATSNNLITASRNFALSKGLSPVSLLDAAASHVSATVIELIHFVKIRLTPTAELEDDDDNSIIADSPADYYGFSTSGTAASDETANSSISSPRRSQIPSNLSKVSKPVPNGIHSGIPHQPNPNSGDSIYKSPNSNVVELRVKPILTPKFSNLRANDNYQNFIESRTDALIPSIQSLVSSIRNNAEPPDVLDHLVAICSTTSQIINKTSEDANSDEKLLNDILQSLAETVDKLEDKGREGEEIGNVKDWDVFVKGLPPLAFAIAKGTKELGGWIEGASNGHDDFS